MEEKVEDINKKLKDKYGSDDRGRPKYRLVWSEDQLEYRRGLFNDFHGDIFIRSEEGVRQRKKYAYVQNRYVLEYLVHSPQKDLPESVGGHYEPRFVFRNGDGSFLEPDWKGCDLLVHFHLHGNFDALVPKTQSQAEDIDKKISNEQISKDRLAIEEALPDLSHSISQGSAVILESNKMKGIDENG